MLPAKRSGGMSYSRGALYDILQNRIYLGEIHHKGKSYSGEHRAIVPKELWDQVQAQMKSDHQGSRRGLRANSPSLLVGLLQDAQGRRFTPLAHFEQRETVPLLRLPSDIRRTWDHKYKLARLPAHDVEKQVVLRLRSFLQSTREIMDELSLPEELLGQSQRLIAAASKQSEDLLSASSIAQRDFVRKVVRRVVVHPDRIEIEAGKKEFRALLNGDYTDSSLRSVLDQQKQRPGGVIRFRVDAQFKRCGIEMRLVVPPRSGRKNSRARGSLVVEGRCPSTRLVQADR